MIRTDEGTVDGTMGEVDSAANRCPATGKIKHATREKAQGHISFLWTQGRGNPDYSEYKCKSCGFWHIGHDRKKLEKRIKRIAVKRKMLPGMKKGRKRK
jgi:hypothetical protein